MIKVQVLMLWICGLINLVSLGMLLSKLGGRLGG